MNKRLFALTLGAGLGLWAGLPVQAQVSRFHGDFGLGVIPLRALGPDQANPNNYAGIAPGYVLKSTEANLLLFNLGLGFDAPLYQLPGGEQSLGVSLNVVGGLVGTTRQDVDGFSPTLLLDFPEYVTYRYGAKSGKHSKKDFGLGLGLGYRYGRYFLPFSSPSAMLEGVYATASTDWFIRLSADLRPMRFYNLYSSEGLVEVLRIRELNVQVGRHF